MLIQLSPSRMSSASVQKQRRHSYCITKSDKIMETHKYSFKLKIDLSELETLNRQLHAFCKTTQLSENCMLEINVCLDELFTNIVSYGYEDKLEHHIYFKFTLIDNLLTIRVEDEGIPFNPLGVKSPEKVYDLNNLQVGGLGIHIVKKLMDGICYRRYRGKNHLTLKKVIQKDKCLW